MKSFPIRPASIASCILFFVLLLLIPRSLTPGELPMPMREIEEDSQARQNVPVSFESQISQHVSVEGHIVRGDTSCPRLDFFASVKKVTDPPWITEAFVSGSASNGSSVEIRSRVTPGYLECNFDISGPCGIEIGLSVNPAGRSAHEIGTAVDFCISGVPKPVMVKLAKCAGLRRVYGKTDSAQHYELGRKGKKCP